MILPECHCVWPIGSGRLKFSEAAHSCLTLVLSDGVSFLMAAVALMKKLLSSVYESWVQSPAPEKPQNKTEEYTLLVI